MINIGLSPNLRVKDSFLALKLLFQPWRWKAGKETKKVEEWFKDYFRVKSAVSFNSGRSAEYAILKCLGIDSGDEVACQAFTCVAMVNPILWCQAKPVFVDIEEDSFNLSPADLEKKITGKSRIILIQDTFGVPAKREEIKKITRVHNLLLIEDCAHSLGETHNGQKIGTFGQAAFFSFGRDKIISSIFGGIAITNNISLSKKFVQYQRKLQYPSYFWIFQQLFHPVVSFFILPLYNFLGLGKFLLFIFQKLRFLSFPVYPEEKVSQRPKVFPAKLPNALAILAFNQLKNLEEFNKKRAEIAKIYQEKLKGLPVKLPRVSNLSFLRYPILTEKAANLRKFAKRNGVILGNWYANVIDPKGVDFIKLGYKLGSCQVAEKVARQIVNLPTYPRMSLKEVYEVIKIIYNFFGKKYRED